MAGRLTGRKTVDGRTVSGRTDGQLTVEQTDGLTDELTDGQTDGLTD